MTGSPRRRFPERLRRALERLRAGERALPPGLSSRVAFAGLAGFVVVVLAQHLIAPALPPDVHTTLDRAA